MDRIRLKPQPVLDSTRSPGLWTWKVDDEVTSTWREDHNPNSGGPSIHWHCPDPVSAFPELGSLGSVEYMPHHAECTWELTYTDEAWYWVRVKRVSDAETEPVQ